MIIRVLDRQETCKTSFFEVSIKTAKGGDIVTMRHGR
jgi:hypothetical protein